MRLSLVISTYNRPDALRVCLDSLRGQTLMPDEVVIGDDGSAEDTRAVIDEIRAWFSIPIIHVWHEDRGFRLAMMRNKCVAKASGDYILEIDGDVFMHPCFIEDHIRLSKKGYYVKGGRVNLGKHLTESICKEMRSRKIRVWTKGIESKPENGLRLKCLSLYLAPRYRKHSSPGLGCNMSYWRSDFIAINGYSEFFVGWGGEDWDFANRLQRSGLKKRYLKFSGIIFHLWHEDKHMDNKEKNFKHLDQQNELQAIRCQQGVDQYL